MGHPVVFPVGLGLDLSLITMALQASQIAMHGVPVLAMVRLSIYLMIGITQVILLPGFLARIVVIMMHQESGAWRIEMDRRLRLSIRYQQISDVASLGAVGLLMVAFLLYLTCIHIHPAAASAMQATEGFSAKRQYYLTKATYNGANTKTACAPGYHFASLWEIHDTTELEYNSSLGWTWGDAGFQGDIGMGPPASKHGWVRTGSFSASNQIPGQANCSIWSSTSGYGTQVSLNSLWHYSTSSFPWIAIYDSCFGPDNVWCVEDYSKFIFLPLVRK
jgi:hypothetical protein